MVLALFGFTRDRGSCFMACGLHYHPDMIRLLPESVSLPADKRHVPAGENEPLKELEFGSGGS